MGIGIGSGGRLPVEAIFPGASSIPPNLLNQFWWGWRAAGGAAGTGLFGDDGAMLNNDQSGYGGSTTPGWSTSVFQGDPPYIAYGAGATAVVGAARLGFRTSASTNGFIPFNSDPLYDIIMSTGSPSDPAMGYRYWIGLFGQSGTLGNLGSGVAPGSACIAFRYDSTIDGMTWRAVAYDGITVNAQDTGVTVTDDTRYRLSIHVDQGLVTYTIDGANTVQITANVPAGITPLWLHGLAIKDITALGQIVQPLRVQRIILRLGDRTRFP